MRQGGRKEGNENPIKYEKTFEISDTRRLTIGTLDGKPIIDIREFYMSDDELKPGKKGISLAYEHYQKIKELMPEVDGYIKEKFGK